jgi:predicted Zn finger-like uncharacterized protein
MSSIRLRRLQSDYEKLQGYLKRQPRVRLIQADGNPPERYQLEYQIQSVRQVDDQLQVVASHMVEIFLPLNYPRMPPQCRMLTPIFHPNIAPHAICIGDHWSAGEPLWSMVARIGEMIAYQSYNTKSPLNGEAARWVDQNLARLPLDRAPMFVEDPAAAPSMRAAAGAAAAPRPVPASPAGPPAAAKPAAPSAPAALPSTSEPALDLACPSCQARYRVPVRLAGKRVRCKRCQSVIEIPPEMSRP